MKIKIILLMIVVLLMVSCIEEPMETHINLTEERCKLIRKGQLALRYLPYPDYGSVEEEVVKKCGNVRIKDIRPIGDSYSVIIFEEIKD